MAPSLVKVWAGRRLRDAEDFSGDVAVPRPGVDWWSSTLSHLLSQAGQLGGMTGTPVIFGENGEGGRRREKGEGRMHVRTRVLDNATPRRTTPYHAVTESYEFYAFIQPLSIYLCTPLVLLFTLVHIRT